MRAQPNSGAEILEKSTVAAVTRHDELQRRRMREALEACDRNDGVIERGDDASRALRAARKRGPVIE